MEFCKEIIDIIENHGFTAHKIEKQCDDYYVEIGQFTPAGEDWWETIWFDGTDEGFSEGVKERYLNFDIDDEAALWIEHRGKYGVPSSIRTLVEDAEWKDDKLKEFSDALAELIAEKMYE